VHKRTTITTKSGMNTTRSGTNTTSAIAPSEPKETESAKPKSVMGDPERATVLMHVAEPRRQLMRYYGAYSNAARGRRQRLAGGVTGKVAAAPASVEDDGEGCADVKLFRRRWRELIRRIYEVDPLVCPWCRAEMRIIALIIVHAVVDKILRHLKRREEAGRERGPPHAADLEAAS
jgi:hypothetical protein